MKFFEIPLFFDSPCTFVHLDCTVQILAVLNCNVLRIALYSTALHCTCCDVLHDLVLLGLVLWLGEVSLVVVEALHGGEPGHAIDKVVRPAHAANTHNVNCNTVV